MSALYIMRYHGQQDQGMGAIYIGKGTIVGVDIGGGRYHGTFQDQGGRLRATVNLSMPQGGTLVTGQQLQPEHPSQSLRIGRLILQTVRLNRLALVGD